MQQFMGPRFNILHTFVYAPASPHHFCTTRTTTNTTTTALPLPTITGDHTNQKPRWTLNSAFPPQIITLLVLITMFPEYCNSHYSTRLRTSATSPAALAARVATLSSKPCVRALSSAKILRSVGFSSSIATDDASVKAKRTCY